MKNIKVGLIDDHNVLRQSLAKALNSESDIDVTSQWHSAEDMIEAIEAQPIDVLIIDLKLPGISGIEATKKIKKLAPNIKIIVLSAYTDEDNVVKSIEAGVSGYLPKEATIEELVDSIRTVYRGYGVLNPIITKKVMDKFSNFDKAQAYQESLTEIELQILSCASAGNTNKQIADKLCMNDSAVKFYFREIFRKLSAKDRAHAVAIGIKQRLI